MSAFRDPWGIPHIRADSVDDVAWHQGRACALDRAWQLEIERLRGEGRTAELLGPCALEWDRFARRARIDALACAAFARLDDATRSFVSAYVDGVRSGLGDATAPELDELGPAPGDWRPWTPLAILHVQHVLFGSLPSKLFHARARRVLGDEADLLRTEGIVGGSNAFAVGSARTSTGGPIVVGDPHRLFEAPNIYLQVRLACTDPDDSFDVVGLTFPGVPGVQHFAHTGSVAWAVTNAMADYQDPVPLDDVIAPTGPERHLEHRVETILVRGHDPVELDVFGTPAGPVILGNPHLGTAQVLRTPSHETTDLGFGALLPLLRSRSTSDVEAALAQWVEPVNNWLVADRDGSVVHTVAGLVPHREPDGTWRDWLHPLPRRSASAEARLVSANDRCTPDFDALADEFAPPFRAGRINALLDDIALLDVDGALDLLTDVTQTAGDPLLALVPDDLAPGWDGAMDDSSGAAWYAALRDEVVRRICEAPRLAPLREPSEHGPLFEPWSSLTARVAASLHTIVSAERPFGLDTARLVAEAAATVDVRAHRPWPERHVFHPLHAVEQFGQPHRRTAPATPLPGDTDTVRCLAWLPDTSWCIRGSVARVVWDLSDRQNSRWIVPLGASGVEHDPHHMDQHDVWANGGALPVLTAWNQLRKDTR